VTFCLLSLLPRLNLNVIVCIVERIWFIMSLFSCLVTALLSCNLVLDSWKFVWACKIYGLISCFACLLKWKIVQSLKCHLSKEKIRRQHSFFVGFKSSSAMSWSKSLVCWSNNIEDLIFIMYWLPYSFSVDFLGVVFTFYFTSWIVSLFDQDFRIYVSMKVSYSDTWQIIET
jgi:hypothetical protein